MDKEKGLFYSKKRGGVFSFSVSGGFSEAPEHTVPAPSERRRRRKEVDVLSYGDVFFLDSLLRGTPYHEVFRDILPESSDLLMSLVYFYVLKGGAREYMRPWWDGSYASVLFPSATPYGGKITALYKKLADPEVQLRFSKAYRLVYADDTIALESKEEQILQYFSQTGIGYAKSLLK